MTPLETKTLEIIMENKGALASQIAKELNISTDYCRLICRNLIRNKIIKFSEGQYKIAGLAKKKLEKTKKKKAVKLSNLTPERIEILGHNGFRSLEDIAFTSVPRLMETIQGLSLKQAAYMINEARSKLRKDKKTIFMEIDAI